MTDEEIRAALDKASDEMGLDEGYRACVRPLLRTGPDGYPPCCGGGCDPCSELLNRVADRTLLLLGVEKLGSR